MCSSPRNKTYMVSMSNNNDTGYKRSISRCTNIWLATFSVTLHFRGGKIAREAIWCISGGGGEAPLLGKHVPTNAQPKKEGYPLLGNRPVNTSRGNEYETTGDAMFSVVRAVLVAMQRALNTLQ
jgi:hypothetical protein